MGRFNLFTSPYAGRSRAKFTSRAGGGIKTLPPPDIARFTHDIDLPSGGR